MSSFDIHKKFPTMKSPFETSSDIKFNNTYSTRIKEHISKGKLKLDFDGVLRLQELEDLETSYRGLVIHINKKRNLSWKCMLGTLLFVPMSFNPLGSALIFSIGALCIFGISSRTKDIMFLAVDKKRQSKEVHDYICSAYRTEDDE
jgi:hypothetical protein